MTIDTTDRPAPLTLATVRAAIRACAERRGLLDGRPGRRREPREVTPTRRQRAEARGGERHDLVRA